MIKPRLSKKGMDKLMSKPSNVKLTRPEFAKVETITMRYIRHFHEQFLGQLAKNKIETLRSLAWQIDAYLDEFGKYKDTDFIRTILSTIEFYIQKKGGTDWSIAKAKKNLQGRTRGINQFSKEKPDRKRPPVPLKLSQSIENVLIGIPRREVKKA